MIDSIKQFFEKNIAPSQDTREGVSEHALRLATAALLVEMTRIDREVKEEERHMVTQAIREKFGLSDEETSTLLHLAEEEVEGSSSYYEFTSLINKGFTADQKKKVVEHLWQIAFADAGVDKYEEHLVRKIADLLSVPHKDFIEAKLRVKRASQGEEA